MVKGVVWYFRFGFCWLKNRYWLVDCGWILVEMWLVVGDFVLVGYRCDLDMFLFCCWEGCV